MRTLPFCLMLLAINFCIPGVAAEDTSAKVSPRVHAFYYPWYGNVETDGTQQHWNHAVAVRNGPTAGEDPVPPRSFPGNDDIGANFFPKLGCYSSNSPADLTAHMQQIRRAGIGVLAVSWWGNDSYTDRALPKVLDAAAKHGIAVNFHIEPFPGRNAETTRRAIQYIIDTYGSHSAIQRDAKHGKRPMFYVYDSYLTPADQWATILATDGEKTIRGTKYDSVVIGLWVKRQDGQFMLDGGFDGFYTYFATDRFTYGSTLANWPTLATFARQHKLLFIPSVGPGYEDTRIRPWNGRNTRRRENGAYYDRAFQAAIDTQPSAISITSYNEWHEGTQIEPAVSKRVGNYAYRDYLPRSPEYYLDRTRHWVCQYDAGRK